MTKLEEYYNKFNEEKRLDSRHGRVEFITSMKYIHKYLDMIKLEMSNSEGMNSGEINSRDISSEYVNHDGVQQEVLTNQTEATYMVSNSKIKILDLGAGTGRYSVPLAEEGYDVTAVELVKHNLGRLKQKSDKVKAYQGNAMKLKRFEDNSFDLTLLFGPMYHLHDEEDKLKALTEAKRVTRPGGIILVAYIMNEFSVITYAFKERHIKEGMENGMLDESFHTTAAANELYSMMRLEDIDALNEKAQIKREQIIAADGAANYIRRYLNALDEDEFDYFVEYHLSTCERMDLMGASGHTVDILRVDK